MKFLKIDIKINEFKDELIILINSYNNANRENLK